MPDAASDAGELIVFFERKHKRWVVRSRDLAVHTAHEHFNILGAVRVAEAEMAAAGLRSPVIWGQYLARNRRWNPACQIPLEVLRRIRLHNVPGCRRVPEVLAEYVRLLEEREMPAEPAPDSEIRPPDPEPAETLEPAIDTAAELGRRLSGSWLINSAVERLVHADEMSDRLRDDLKRWNSERCRLLYEWVLARRGSWAEANQIFTTIPTGTVGRVECR
jgi:hypothetical protein